ANVLVDQRLPAAFRSRVRALIAQKLSGAGVPATVQVSQVGFPPRNPPPYVDPQPPKAPEKPPEPEQKPQLAAATPASSRIVDKLIESAPALAIAILVGTVLLVLGGLFFFAARRPQDGWYGDLAPEVTPPAGEAPREAFPAQRARKLEKELADHRPLRNQVVREALVKGEHAAVAWARKPEVSSGYAQAAADELRARLDDTHAGHAESDRALSDLLDSLSREEQDSLLEKLRREGDDGRAFSGLFTESSLAWAPP